MIQTIRMGKSAWQIERPPYYKGWPVYPQAFICPQCLYCWATVGEPPFQVKGVPCEMHPEVRHRIITPVPGSLLDNSTFTVGPDLDLLEALPPELKRRELDLHIRQSELEEKWNTTQYSPESTPLSSAPQGPAKPTRWEQLLMPV